MVNAVGRTSLPPSCEDGRMTKADGAAPAATSGEDWRETLHDLQERRNRTRAMGGEERLAKHHGKGKLDARARIDRLVDTGSFREIGTLVGGEVAADAIVVGS